MSEQKKAFKFKGVRFLVVVLLMYGLLFVLQEEAFWQSVTKSVLVLKMLLPIFVIVILLMGVIGYLFQEKRFLNTLPQTKGLRGWLVALFVGLLSHGPMYAWYPMLQQLRQKGLRDGYIATFFYARAVKLPLLPLMVDYFGLSFTVILTLYIMVASLLQGWLVERLEGLHWYRAE